MLESWSEEDGKLVHKRTALIDLDRGQKLRDAPSAPVSESWHVGTIPLIVMEQWFKEAGVAWDDRPACHEVIRKKLLDGDFNKFRVKEGRF